MHSTHICRTPFIPGKAAPRREGMLDGRLLFPFSYLSLQEGNECNEIKVRVSVAVCGPSTYHAARRKAPAHQATAPSPRHAACRQLPHATAGLPRRCLAEHHMHHFCTNTHTDTILCMSAGHASLLHNRVIICIFIVS